MRLAYTRKQFVAFVFALQTLTESQPDSAITHEVLYELTVKLYKRLLDVQRPQYTLRLTRVQQLAFMQAYEQAASVTCPALSIAVASELYDKIAQGSFYSKSQTAA